MDKKLIGFNAEVSDTVVEADTELFSKVMPQDLVKFGLIPEFIGRVPVTVALDSLDTDALVRILKEPKHALVKQSAKLFELDDVKLEFDDEALNEIAKQSSERKTGARGLRSIMEGIMNGVMYEIPSDDTIEKCIITKDVVDGESEPLIERKSI